MGAWGRAMNVRAWTSTASLVLAERITEQRRRDQGQPSLTVGELRQQAMPLARRLADALLAGLARH
jgi:hypothetical protein